MNANSYDTPGTQGGNREDLRDVLTILEPEETPYVSMARKGPAPAATLVEVLGDTLRKPRTNGTREGSDTGKGNNKATKRKRFGVYLHRTLDEYGVTDVQQAISKQGGTAGISNELTNDKAKTIREAKRDMEAICCSNVETTDGNDKDMRTRGNFCWLDPVGGTLQTVKTVPDDFRTTTWNGSGITTGQHLASVTVPTEAQLNGVLQFLQRIHGGSREFQCIGGDQYISTVDNFTRVNSSSTTNRYQVHDDAADHEISLMVKVFSSSFGTCNFIPTQFNQIDAAGAGDPYAAQILYMPLWELNFLDKLHAVDNPETAGGQSGYVKSLFANLCLSPKGNGVIKNS